MVLGLPIVILILGLGSAVVTATGIWWLTPLASNWGMVDTMINATTIVTGIFFVAIHVLLAYMVYNFHQSRYKKAAFIDENPTLERWLVIGTSIGIFALLVPGLLVYSDVVAGPSEEALVVEVLGEQWRWNYRFPGEDGEFGNIDLNLVTRDNVFGIDLDDPSAADDIILVGPEPLYLPVDRPVIIQYRSKDVLHAFWIPEFRLMIDTVPGMVTEQWFIPTRTGHFQAACAEYCGVGHYLMYGDVYVVEQDEFEQWLAERPTAAELLSNGNGEA